jgi:hypothetical protein
MDNSLMFDLETLSTRNDACIVAIGAAVFNRDQRVIDSGQWLIAREAWTGHIDPATVGWWLEQSSDAQHATFPRTGLVLPHTAATDLHALWNRHACKTIWANDPHFDFVILENWWRRHRLTATIQYPTIPFAFPFKYNTPRSYRTIREIASKMGWTDEMNSAARGMYVSHCALDDACAQARAVVAMEQFILNGGLKHAVHL